MTQLRLSVSTPNALDAHLQALLREMQIEPREAGLLPFTHPGAFEPETDNCHFNAWLKMRNDGGAVISGWILGQDRVNRFSEAQFHTVWVSGDHELFDVTPRADDEEYVLFVPDPKRHIELSEHDSKPAVVTYDNVRLIGNSLQTPLRRIKRQLNTDFVVRHGLWPWSTP